jgi:hypothetical protein
MKRVLVAIFLLAVLLWSCQQPSAPKAERDYMAIGDSLSKQTFEKLSGTLKAKISAEGFPAAVAYCQVEAKTLTESFENENIEIRRTSLKPRNSNNAPDDFEHEVLEHFQMLQANGDSLTPVLKTDVSGNTHYFKPIMLQPLCAGCHGDTQKDIAAETLQTIREKYPNDLATGYMPGDLRGVWHITILKH